MPRNGELTACCPGAGGAVRKTLPYEKSGRSRPKSSPLEDAGWHLFDCNAVFLQTLLRVTAILINGADGAGKDFGGGMTMVILAFSACLAAAWALVDRFDK